MHPARINETVCLKMLSFARGYFPVSRLINRSLSQEKNFKSMELIHVLYMTTWWSLLLANGKMFFPVNNTNNNNSGDTNDDSIGYNCNVYWLHNCMIAAINVHNEKATVMVGLITGFVIELISRIIAKLVFVLIMMIMHCYYHSYYHRYKN